MQTNVHEDRLELVLLAFLWGKRGKAASNAAAIVKGIKLLADNSADAAQAGLDRLVATGQVARIEPKTKKGKPGFQIAAAGEARATQTLGLGDPSVTLTKLVPTHFVPFALGLTPPDKKSQKDFNKQLPLAVCVRTRRLEVPLNGKLADGKIELVKLALSRSHGVPVEKIYLKKLPTGELPALVVGPILDERETAAGDLDKLLVSVACKILQVSKAADFPLAIVQQWLAEGASAVAPASDVADAPAPTPDTAALHAGPTETSPHAGPVATSPHAAAATSPSHAAPSASSSHVAAAASPHAAPAASPHAAPAASPHAAPAASSHAAPAVPPHAAPATSPSHAAPATSLHAAPTASPSHVAPTASSSHAEPAASPPHAGPAASAPSAPAVDLPTFAKRVVEAARAVATAGRDGVSSLGDKVLVHYCWRRYEQMFGPYPLEQFKHDLSIINGKHLDLVREDLIPAERREEFFESEVKRGVSSFHYVRIGQLGVRHGAG